MASLNDQVHSKARSRASTELTHKHPVLFKMLYACHARTEGLTPNQIRSRAIQDLVDLFQNEYDDLRYAKVEELKKELGWVDGRSTWRNPK